MKIEGEKILVTGIHDLIGLHLLSNLRRMGATVLVLVTYMKIWVR
jgi:nucleoside-diphosphate-sugar epimerase